MGLSQFRGPFSLTILLWDKGAVDWHESGGVVVLAVHIDSMVCGGEGGS